MIRIEDAGGHSCCFATHLITLDNMLRVPPIQGTDAAYKARRAVAFVANPNGRTMGPEDLPVDGYTTVDPYNPPVKYRRSSNGHKPAHHAVSV